jgi:hypothetical protein
MRFRKIMHPLMTNGRVVMRKSFTKDTDLTKVLAVGGVLLVLLLPVVSIRFLDPMVWLSALMGYIIGLNLGEFAYYLFIRRMERSTGQAIFMFDSEDPITQERIMGYRLEKIGD